MHEQHARLSIGVGGVVFKNNNEILLTKRKSHPSVWTIPSGYAEGSEAILSTIIRETNEETGITIRPIGVIGIRQRISKKEGNNLWIIVLASYLSGTPTPDGTELKEARFFAINQALKKRLTPVTRRLLAQLLKNNKPRPLTLIKGTKESNYFLFI